ncbi:cytochrome P450 [Pseudonocardia dioxanivorans]|jgi:cytochrome P450|uniref:cytochrome P450 n=1 Tax=Pseudonocardia dioxanivorans TaxID=240495 RepID=UPI0014050F43|nr:cytochrome P450 [Pseudonocardia dioxanivorans]
MEPARTARPTGGSALAEDRRDAPAHQVGPGGYSAALRARHAERYAAASGPLADLVRIEDPAFYVDPWPVYDRLRAEAPVWYYEPFDTWVVTGYDDVRHVARTPEVYSVRHGKLLYDGVKKQSGTGMMFAGDGDFIGHTDPPRHGELRRIMQPPFTPRSLNRLQEMITSYAGSLVAALEPDEPVEWVETVAARLPLLVIAAILGIPESETEFFDHARSWSDAIESIASKDLTPEQQTACVDSFRNMNGYIGDVFDRRRREPGDDFLSSLLATHLDGAKLSEANLVGFAQALMAAGNDTVRAMLSELVAHLAGYPNQLALLAADPSLVPNAVEEALRFAPPPRGFARQVIEPTTLGGQELRPGERVWMAFDAANRDPAKFDRPHVFDIAARRANRNLAFGFGTHVCIAAALARVEAVTLLRTLLARFPRFEIAGPGRRVESFLRNGWVELPIVFHAG